VFGALVHDEVADERTCANSGVLASTTAVMGNLQANTALQYLGLTKNPLTNKLLIWDGRQMQQRLMGYRKDPECPVCSSPD
jgi:adenylyltransferase/sulfurtransferase